LRAVPITKINIVGQLFKVMNAIFYHHVSKKVITSICRKGISNIWIEVNDAQIGKRQWPRDARDICIIFLQKIDK